MWLPRISRRWATAVNPVRIQKGAILRLEGRFVEITASKSNPVGTQFEYAEVQDKAVKGKFRVKSYETVDLVDEEFTVEVERVDEATQTILTVTETYDPVNVPLSLLPEGEKLPSPGSRLVIMMDEGVFVRIKLKANASRPKWQFL